MVGSNRHHLDMITGGQVSITGYRFQPRTPAHLSSNSLPVATNYPTSPHRKPHLPSKASEKTSYYYTVDSTPRSAASNNSAKLDLIVQKCRRFFTQHDGRDPVDTLADFTTHFLANTSKLEDVNRLTELEEMAVFLQALPSSFTPMLKFSFNLKGYWLEGARVGAGMVVPGGVVRVKNWLVECLLKERESLSSLHLETNYAGTSRPWSSQNSHSESTWEQDKAKHHKKLIRFVDEARSSLSRHPLPLHPNLVVGFRDKLLSFTSLLRANGFLTAEEEIDAFLKGLPIVCEDAARKTLKGKGCIFGSAGHILLAPEGGVKTVVACLLTEKTPQKHHKHPLPSTSSSDETTEEYLTPRADDVVIPRKVIHHTPPAKRRRLQQKRIEYLKAVFQNAFERSTPLSPSPLENNSFRQSSFTTSPTLPPVNETTIEVDPDTPSSPRPRIRPFTTSPPRPPFPSLHGKHPTITTLHRQERLQSKPYDRSPSPKSP